MNECVQRERRQRRSLLERAKVARERTLLATAAAGALSLVLAAPARAADLGGDCCADLEERVAELEATTVRKGNRKVSVKLSGQVNRALLFWDDGDETNAYVVDNSISQTRFRFTGDANWKPGWKIGFALEWGQSDPGSANVNAVNDDGGSSSPTIRQAHWWVKSDKFGKLSLGQLSTASDATAEVNLSGGSVAGGSLQYLLWSGFRLVNNAVQTTPTGFRGPLDWGELNPGNMDGLSRRDGIRYDSPAFAGFTISGGWYEDDMWDVALRFARQWNSVLVAAAISYASDKEGTGISFCSDATDTNPLNGGGSPADCEQVAGSASILHQPTGLFATFAAGQSEDNNRNNFASGSFFGLMGIDPGVSIDDEANFWYANAGIYRRFNSHGKTSIGFEYYKGECGFGGCGDLTRNIGFYSLLAGGTIADFLNAPPTAFIAGTEMETWGVFLVQHIDAAATEFYLSYHHSEGDVDLIDAAGNAVPADSFSDIDVFLAGARVKF